MVPLVPLQARLGGLLIALLFLVLFLAAVVWVYQDATTNSDHPAFLWALVVFLAPLLGIVLYFVLGRR